MKTTFIIRLWEAFKRAIGRSLRAALLGLVIGFVLVEGLALLLNHSAGQSLSVALAWPPSVNLGPTTAFVHVIAVIFALTLAYLLGFSVAVKETFQGLIYAAEHVDEAVGAIANEGLNLADAAVDAIDGPNRHGFLGRRGPAAAQQQRQTTA